MRLVRQLPTPARPAGRRLAGALAVVLAVAGTVPAAAVPGASVRALRAQQAAQTWEVPRTARFAVLGHGYGHGHGMSQYGAEGAARQGLGARDIVSFYYPGTQLGRAGRRVRVLVSADTSDDVVVRPRSGLRARSVATGRLWELPDNGATRWRLRVGRDGTTRLSYLAGRWRRFASFAGEGEFHASGAPVTLVTPSGQTAYRGRLRAAAPSRGSRARDTVNVVALETYLRGVVPLEIPASWSPAAVQAQAIAARTYAAYERQHPRAAHYQLCDTTSCQVYGGASAEQPGSDAAIRATRRVALTYEGRPAFTQFSSSSGGWTSAGSAPYLVAQHDPYDGWPGNGVHDWRVPVTDATFERAYPGIGDLRRISITARDGNGEWGGRVRRMTLDGSKGSVTVSGDDLRWALGLRSTWFTVDGLPAG
jgi:stage II sporulation protein D